MSAAISAHPRGWAAFRQTALGLALAGLIILSWLTLHLYGVFFHRWTAEGFLVAPVIIALQCWLSVGLFIVAHDAMHGSLAPFRPGLNRRIGRLCVGLYAGFSYDRLIAKHFAHHRRPGTDEDPDFHADGPREFAGWYLAFFTRYFGPHEFMIVSGALLLYLLLGASPANMIAFWALPAILSSVQLFYFGTYLPHRHDDEPFGDAHRARSNELSWLASLLTCFHFGYHHEHHTHPHVPWWRLPSVRASRPISAARRAPSGARPGSVRSG